MFKVKNNPDSEFVKEFKKEIKSNGGYCPCQVIRSKDTKCMCKEFREQLKNGIVGFCHCGLYQVVEEED